MNAISLISPLLRDRENNVSRILNLESSIKEISVMLLISILMFSGYGFIIGASQCPLQALSSALKLPLLFYFTSLICFPTLYFFLSFLGAKQHFKQLLTFVILCNTYISLVLAAFAPVAFFFLIAGYSYALFKFINILIFTVAGFTGIYLFYREIKKIIFSIDKENAGSDKSKKGLIFLRAWAIMFAFIGLQLSFTLSPFFGFHGTHFIFITPENSNFFSDLLETIASLFIKV